MYFLYLATQMKLVCEDVSAWTQICHFSVCYRAVQIFTGLLNVDGVAESLESFAEKCNLF